MHSGSLAKELISRAEWKLEGAVDWLLKVLRTRDATIVLKAAIWGAVTDSEVQAPDGSRLLAFASLPDSQIKTDLVQRSARGSVYALWSSSRFFQRPELAFVRAVQGFPYIRKDNQAFLRVEEIVREAQEIWTVLEAVCVGSPLSVGYWLEYEDRDLEIRGGGNFISWSLPEVAPTIMKCVPVHASDIAGALSRCAELAAHRRSQLLRSMRRFVLNQCRREMTDRAIDLCLAFEIAESGKSDNAPLSWKVGLRTAQLTGGTLSERQSCRDKIAKLYKLRNRGAHGASIPTTELGKHIQTVGDASQIYVQLMRRLLALRSEPNWSSIEMQGPD